MLCSYSFLSFVNHYAFLSPAFHSSQCRRHHRHIIIIIIIITEKNSPFLAIASLRRFCQIFHPVFASLGFITVKFMKGLLFLLDCSSGSEFGLSCKINDIDKGLIFQK
jgi:hypothetical protein